MRHGKLKYILVAFASALLFQGCKVSYKLNQAAIDYATTKTFTIETFSNRAAYQWAPMAPMLNTYII